MHSMPLGTQINLVISYLVALKLCYFIRNLSRNNNNHVNM